MFCAFLQDSLILLGGGALHNLNTVQQDLDESLQNYTQSQAKVGVLSN